MTPRRDKNMLEDSGLRELRLGMHGNEHGTLSRILARQARAAD
jgi:hypothetical protein